MSDRQAPKFLSFLAGWTFIGTLVTISGLVTPMPRTSIFWPTMITPHWLGALIGAGASLTLGLIHGAYSKPNPDAVKLQAARGDMATALRAYIDKRQADD